MERMHSQPVRVHMGAVNANRKAQPSTNVSGELKHRRKPLELTIPPARIILIEGECVSRGDFVTARTNQKRDYRRDTCSN